MNLILKLRNGSKLYGLDHADSDDDYVGIYVEHPDYLFTGREKRTINLRETPASQRNGPGDITGVAYSLRHFYHLAANCNPSILALFFAPKSAIVESTEHGLMVMANRSPFFSKIAEKKFRGYLMSQMDRLRGLRKGHIPSRPEIVNQFGYDTKYAQQVARLTLQGTEFLSKQVITLPMPEHERDLCMGIRFGEYSFKECLAVLDDLVDGFNEAASCSTLPAKPDYETIADLSQVIHTDCWSRGLFIS